jgi:hypothetical protein
MHGSTSMSSMLSAPPIIPAPVELLFCASL